jgi:SAM-dependent methyltransferase
MQSEADPRRIVADGYDRIAETYAAWVARGEGVHRQRHLALLEAELPAGASVLDLGCGAGLPVAGRLAERFVVTGIDISARQIELARQNVPAATFIHADMTTVELPPASFDAIVAFFSIIHVPRDDHAAVYASIARWLKSGGLLVLSTGAHSDPGTVEDWLGAPTYWSFPPSAGSQDLIRAAGLEIVQAREETSIEDGQPVTFLWVTARKPAAAPD